MEQQSIFKRLLNVSQLNQEVSPKEILVWLFVKLVRLRTFQLPLDFQLEETVFQFEIDIKFHWNKAATEISTIKYSIQKLAEK